MLELTWTGPESGGTLAQWGVEQFTRPWRRWFDAAPSRGVEPGRIWSLRWGERREEWLPAGVETLGDEGYLLAGAGSDRRGVGVAARTEKGFVNGLFGLLGELGCGFYLGGEAIPPRPWRTEFPPGWRKVCNPRLAVRGLLPWHNFANSPTTWDFADYARYFDLLAAQRMNLAMFHSYDYEPHGAYRWKGQWAPATVRRNHVWGWQEEAVDVTAFPQWAREHFPENRFGPPAVLATTTLEECIAASQELFRKALEHAGRRGIRTCVGFEIPGNPKVPAIRQRFLTQVEHLATVYRPDYLGLWEPESWAQRGWPIPVRGSGWQREFRLYRKWFRHVDSDRRVLEALRLAEFVRLAHARLQRIAPRTRLVLSGWGGDRWMKLAEFFPGLDHLLPPDVIFSALDNIDSTVAPRVADAYGRLSTRRQRWPIVWLESDGNSQWHAQCNVSSLSPLGRDTVKKGCQGILGIHWRSGVEVETEVAYLAQAGWAETTSQDFWTDYSFRCYGTKWGGKMAAVHRHLERLGPGWTGLSPQGECSTFRWESLPEVAVRNSDRHVLDGLRQAGWAARGAVINHTASVYELLPKFDWALFTLEWALAFGEPGLRKRRMLERIGRRLKVLRRSVAAMEPPENGRRRLDDLILWIEFTLGYDAAARLLKPGGAVETLQAEAMWHSENQARSYGAEVARRALARLRTVSLERTMQAYGRRVRTQSQRGNLARMCRDAWPAWIKAIETLEQMAAGHHPRPAAFGDSPPSARR